MARKPGLPEGHELEVDVEGLTEPADIPDFLDMEVQPRPAPTIQRPAPTPPSPEPRKERPPTAEAVSRPSEERKTAAKRAPQPQVRGRNRPPRKEVGFDDETLAMLKDLHADGASQSMEESLTRSEVARAAIRAIYAARNMVEYRGVGPRGRWGTPTARALVDDLTESYIRAVGELYMERYHTPES